MDQNISTSDRARDAVALMTEIFAEIVAEDGRGLLESEDLCLRAGHDVMREALARALELLDDKLCASLPGGVRVHDARERTLATKMGDVSFRCRRCRDEAGRTVVPLADALGLQWGARVSPAARAFLVDAGAEVSFASSAALLASAGGSAVSAPTVMRAVRRSGELCAAEDEAAAASLFADGVAPDAECAADDLCVEADGTWIRLQGAPEGSPGRVEIKALVSYAGKERGGSRVSRVSPVRHGCVGTPAQFWTQGIAAVAGRFDLSRVGRVHFGCDGESFYKDGASYLPGGVESDTHLDPFHVNRAILSCFPAGERRLAGNVLGAAIDGDAASAAALLDAAFELGAAKSHAPRVAAYLRNNEGIIYTGGPSLGTMESEQQHVYGCRMDAVPCAWSAAGADAMARIRSRRCSKRPVPVPTREQSVTPRRASRNERRELAFLAGKVDTRVPKSVGSGRGAEHSASLAPFSAEVRYAAGIDSGMVAIG